MKPYILTDEERAEVKDALKRFVLRCCDDPKTALPGELEILPAMVKLLTVDFAL